GPLSVEPASVAMAIAPAASPAWTCSALMPAPRAPVGTTTETPFVCIESFMVALSSVGRWHRSSLDNMDVKIDEFSSIRYPACMPIEYWTAKQAADFLGVSLGTLYAYVSRKGIRSAPVPGTREHRYLRTDIEGMRDRKGRRSLVTGGVATES